MTVLVNYSIPKPKSNPDVELYYCIPMHHAESNVHLG